MLTLIWIGFILFILGMLALDLGIAHRRSEEVSPTQALRWMGVCVVIALLANVGIYYLYENHVGGLGLNPLYASSGKEAALQYLTGWLVEQTLSLDNVFLMAVIFQYFRVPLRYQHRVLFWGILGALVMRGIFVALGAIIIHSFSWANYFFGAIIIFAAIKMLAMGEDEFDPEESLLYRIMHRIIPTTKRIENEKFLVKVDGRWMATPLLLVLVLIESTDIVFAVDSIPAVFAITSDPFLVFTSNIFAILNLRSSYFALALLVGKFDRLKQALAFVLVFVGIKMALANVYKISSGVSLAVIGALILGGILVSIYKPKNGGGNLTTLDHK